MFTIWLRRRPDARHALIVDVDEGFRHVAACAFRELGLEAVPLHDGNAALRWLDTKRAALIAVESDLPALDGVSLCLRVRAHPRASTVPVLFASAASDVDSQMRALAAGADAFLKKPVDIAELLDAAERLLSAGTHRDVSGTSWIERRGM